MPPLSPVSACILSALIGYLFGCPNLAHLISRIKGVDLRKTGTKNLGTSNTLVTFGPFWAVLVFIHDAGKAVLAVLLCRALFPGFPLTGFAAGISAVLGHIYPFYMKFRGGKGFASYLGMILAIDWRVGLLVLLGVAAVTVITNYLMIASTLTILFFPVWTGLVTKSVPAVCLVASVSIVYLLKHRENYARLAKGTEIGIRPAKKLPPEARKEV